MIEVVVALALLATSVMAVFGALRTCAGAAYHARMLTQSVLLAERLLVSAKDRETPAFETTQGQQEPFAWTVQTVQTPVDDLAAVCVRVRWQEQQREQEFELRSLVQMKSFTQ
jgi:Tfp pilus assembly protein PilV